jgi:hypothetical protein
MNRAMPKVKIINLETSVTKIKRFQIIRASIADTVWLKETLNREGAPFGTSVIAGKDHRFTLQKGLIQVSRSEIFSSGRFLKIRRQNT